MDIRNGKDYSEVREEYVLPSSHAPVVFNSNPCNFASFRTVIKSLLFSLRAYNFQFLLRVYPSCHLQLLHASSSVL